MDFDFDEWMNLAKTDPAEFERRRTLETRSLIDQAPERNRDALTKLQDSLDKIHRTYEPAEALRRMTEMLDSRMEHLKMHTTTAVSKMENLQELWVQQLAQRDQ